MLTKVEMQDIVLDHLKVALQDTVTIRERITDVFNHWFQDSIIIPVEQPPDQGNGGGGGQGGGDQPPDEGSEEAPAA